MPPAGSSVLVGMSGGVDSTLAAVLLQERGCRVTGVTMSMWDGSLALPAGARPRNSCFGPGEKNEIEECRKFCAERGIGHHIIDVSGAYRREVLEYFKAEYRAGRTPNPCVRCNRKVKFGALLEGARNSGIGFDFFCTGHYASVVRPQDSIQAIYGDAADSEIRPCMIRCADDYSKDQSYFLYGIPSEVLEKVRFPLGGLEKRRVVEMARERGLAAAEREESQDFVPAETLDALFADAPAQTGNFVSVDGRVLGRHRGIERYTVGQRRGLGVSANVPLYVRSINPLTNEIVLAEDADLFCGGLVMDGCAWPAGFSPRSVFRAEAKIRLGSKPVPALVEPTAAFGGGEGSFRVTFDEPQRAVAPGQSVVLYREGVVIGGGIISRPL